MAVNKVNEICNIIKNEYKTEANCARKMGWKRQKLNKITCLKKQPNIAEINAMSQALNMSVDDLVAIFLSYWSPNGQHKKEM